MSRHWALGVISIFSLVVSSSATFSQTGVASLDPIVIIVDKSDSAFVCTVNSQVVPLNKLISHLNSKHPWPARAPRVIVLAHDDIRLSLLNDVRGSVVAAGFEWPRVFIFKDDKFQMEELTLSHGRGIPFTTDARTLGKLRSPSPAP